MPVDPNAPVAPGTIEGIYSELGDIHRAIDALFGVRSHIGAGSISAGQIGVGQITADHVLAGAITAGHIESGSIHTEHLAAGAVDTSALAAFAVTAEKITTNAITADKLAATLTISSTIQTGTAGSRVVIDPSGLRGYDTVNVEKFRFDTATGSLVLAGAITAESNSAVPITYVTSGNIVSGTIITIDPGGYLQTAPSNPKVKLDSTGLVAYNASGVVTAQVNAVTSAFTGGTFQTSAPGTAGRVVMDSSGIVGYGGVGQELTEKFKIASGTATITGGTIQTAPNLSPNRVVLDSTGIRAYGSDGTTERVNISGGNATITVQSGVIRTAATGARVEMDGANNKLSIYDASQERVRLNSTWGLSMLSGGSLDIADNALATWRNNPLATGQITAGMGGIRYTDGSGTWNWALAMAKYTGSENAGVVLRASDGGNTVRADVVCWNQPSASSNKRRVDLTVRNDANNFDYTLMLRGAEGDLQIPNGLRGQNVSDGIRVWNWNGTHINFHMRDNGRCIAESTAGGDGQEAFYIGSTSSAFTRDLLRLHAANKGDSVTYNAIYFSNGSSGLRFAVDGRGVIYSTSASIVTLSDAAAKTNIRDLEPGRPLVLKLKPRRFDWIDNAGHGNVGFVAQEVRNTLPNLVEETPDGQLGLRTGDLLPYVVSAVQEQDRDLSDFKKAVFDALARVDRRVAALEALPAIEKALRERDGRPT